MCHVIFLLICLMFAVLASMHLFQQTRYSFKMWCHNATCRAAPQLQGFDSSDFASLRFASLLSLSVSVPPHPPLALSLSPLTTFDRPSPPPLPRPRPSQTRTQHAVENNVSKSHILGATGSITRLSRLPVGFIYRKDIFLTRIVLFSASFDLYLSCTTFEIAFGFSIHKL